LSGIFLKEPLRFGAASNAIERITFAKVELRITDWSVAGEEYVGPGYGDPKAGDSPVRQG
jgi:hypothetical protein